MYSIFTITVVSMQAALCAAAVAVNGTTNIIFIFCDALPKSSVFVLKQSPFKNKTKLIILVLIYN